MEMHERKINTLLLSLIDQPKSCKSQILVMDVSPRCESWITIRAAELFLIATVKTLLQV